MERNHRIHNPQAQGLDSHVILFDSALCHRFTMVTMWPDFAASSATSSTNRCRSLSSRKHSQTAM